MQTAGCQERCPQLHSRLRIFLPACVVCIFWIHIADTLFGGNAVHEQAWSRRHHTHHLCHVADTVPVLDCFDIINACYTLQQHLIHDVRWDLPPYSTH